MMVRLPNAGVDLPREKLVAANVVPVVITFQYSLPLVAKTVELSAVPTPVAFGVTLIVGLPLAIEPAVNANG